MHTMNVTLTIDSTVSRDVSMRDEINGWLHHVARSWWTVDETEADDDARLTTLTYGFRDPLNAEDFYRWRGLGGRGSRA
jgi:hypothetical protein